MGLEADCTLEWKGRRHEGKALLETEELLFRGPERLKIRRADVTRIAVDGGALRVTFGGDTASFALGAAAEKWARALATKKSRLEKLGVAPGLVVSVAGVEDASFRDELREAIGSFEEGARAESDIVFLGVHAEADLECIGAATRALKPAGALWIVRPKGRAPVTEASVRTAARAAGLVDMKVAAFSATHTADKYVIPVAARAKSAPKKR